MPPQVIWENLQFGPNEQLCRSIIVNILLFLLCCLGSAILLGTGITSTTEIISSELGWDAENFFIGLGVWVLQLLLIVLGHVMVIAGAIIFAIIFERAHTHGEKETSIMLKISFFQVINNVITVTALAFLSIGENDKVNPIAGHQFDYPAWYIPKGTHLFPVIFPSGWYPAGATLIINSLIGDLLFVGIVIDCLRPPDLFFKYFLAPKAKTQGRMNELCAPRTLDAHARPASLPTARPTSAATPGISEAPPPSMRC